MIFKREFLKNLKALVIWILVICSLIILMMSIYPQFSKQQQSIEALLKAYPQGMLKAFGMDRLSFATPLGFYAVEGYIYVTLFGSIYSVLLASNILSKEQNEKTIEFLLSKPVTRFSIVSQKLLVVFVNLIIFNIAIAISSFIGFHFSKNSTVPTKIFILINVAPLILHLTFASISFVISILIKKGRNILSASLGLVLITYFLGIISGISDKFEKLKYISPFKYVEAADIVNNKEIKALYLIIMLIIIVISNVAAYVIYQRKNISV